MGLNTKLRLNNAKFEQISGNSLTLSGNTNIADSGTMQYLTDQSSNFNARSVPDVGYVSGLTSQGITSAANGLTKSGQEVTLGGALTGDTNITGNHILSLGTAGSNIDTLNAWAGTDINMYAVTGDITLSASTGTLEHNADTIEIKASNSILITDSGNNGGAKYAADYSGDYDNRSLVDKEYVDTEISSLTGTTSQAVTGATNGLTKQGQEVILGGTLTGDTTVNSDGNAFQVTNADLLNFAATGGNWSHYYNVFDQQSTGLEILNQNSVTSVATRLRMRSDIDLNASYSGGSFNLNIQDSLGAYFTDGQNSGGIKYSADYSGDFIDRSLVDKGYVDGLTTQGITGATNGLTKQGQQVKLGGTLTGNTVVDADTYQFDLERTDGSRTDRLRMGGLGPAVWMSTTDGSDQALVAVETTGTRLSTFTTGGTSFSIDLNRASGMLVTDTINGEGLKYSSNYASGYTSRSLVDKEYVDTEINNLTGTTSQAVTGATNGLTKQGQQVKLGGTLTGNTAINGNFNLDIGQSTNVARFFVKTASAGADILVGPGFAASSQITLTDSALSLKNFDGSGNQQLISFDTTNGIQVEDQVLNRGIVYTNDYSSNYTLRSIPDVAYVTGLTNQGITSAVNGLTKSGQEVSLGGNLTGDTTISASTDVTLCVATDFLADCVSYLTMEHDSSHVVGSHVEGRLYYESCALNFDREISGVTLQIGEESFVRITNVTGSLIENGSAVYIEGAASGLPSIEKSIATNICSQGTFGLMTHDISNNNEGYVTTEGIVRGVNTNSFTAGELLWLSDSVAGGFTNVRPDYPNYNVVLGRVTKVGTTDGEIYVNPVYVPPYTDFGLFTGYTASTQTNLDAKLDTSIFNTYTGDTETRLTDIESTTAVAITGVTNGLTKVGSNDAKLGGSMTEATTIDGAYALTLSPSCDLILKTTGDNRVNIDSQGNGSVSLKSQSGSVTNPASFTNAVGLFADFDQVGGFAVYDNRAGSNQTGIIYASDYSGNFVDRSLVDKAYVDSVATGLNAKAAVLVASTTGITLSGLTTIDGVSLSNGDRILVKDQSSADENGIYSASTGTWGRTEDFDFSPAGEISNGDLIPVLSGDSNASTQWILTTPDPISSGDSLNFSLFSQLLQIGEGDGIDITPSAGVQIISVELANNSALEFVGTGLSVANEIAGSGLTWTSGVLSVNASTTAPTGTEIPVAFGTNNMLYVDSDDFSYTTAANGLSKLDCNVTLGGALTGDTFVSGASGSHSLGFVDLDVFSASFNTGTITDNGGSPAGLEYAADYSASYTCRSLVDAEYVNDAISGGTALTYNNGLTKQGNVISWGGTLTGDTAILYNAANLCFLDSGTPQIQIIADCSCSYVADTSIDNYTCNSSGCISRVLHNNDGSMSLVANNDTAGLTITSPAQGAVYAADYSGNYTARSLVDAEYVTGFTAQGITGATNGLTKSGQDVKMGGTLTENMFIQGDSTYAYRIGFPIPVSSFFASASGGTGGFGLTSVGTNTVNVTGSNSNLNLSFRDSSNDNRCITISDSTFTITDEISSKGIEYATDYSANYTARSLVDAEYVTGQTSTSGVQTVTNGLTKSGTEVKFGGALTGDTLITGSHDLGFNISALTGTTNCIDFKSFNNDMVLETSDANLNICGALGTKIDTFNGDTCITASDAIKFNGGTNGFLVSADTGTYTDTGGSPAGIEYAADYSGTYTNRSLVDKEYVDNSAGSINGVNGLSRVDDNIVLGGVLTGSTTICGNGSHNLTWGQTTQEINTHTINACSHVINFGDVVGGSNYGLFDLGTGTFDLTTFNAGGTFGIGADDTNGFRIRNTSTNDGIKYFADYSSGYVARSLVDAAYVTGLTSQGITTANNGLTKSDQNVYLGGALTGSTEITGAGVYDLTLGSTTDKLANANIYAGTDITLSGSSVVLGGTFKLNDTPVDGLESDSVLLWNSGDKTVKKISGGSLGDKNNIYSTTTVTGNTTLATGDTYVIFIDTSSSSITITLPATAIDGQVFKFKDISGNALTNNVTVDGNGNNIDGASTALINTDYGAFELIYDSTTDQWLSLSFVN